MPLPPGTRLGRYEVRSQIGAGGMGEVYLARDTTELERTVAVKVLPSEMARDPERMRRFIQEAKTASSLNHPNIITIHEIGEVDSSRFIVTEFVEGETLRQKMTRSRLTLREVLDVSIQIASALVAAHKAGVVHRDIKPENVMLREDSIVKVLDFGIAKLSERRPQAGADTEAPTRAMVNTGPGTVMGTFSYMSPEQARGLPVDERTDIWSLGVVLYEIVSGRLPFEGETATDVLAVILHREPASLLLHRRDVPEELERIVEKALTKDREERYQVVKDMALDLKRLRQRLDVEAEIERSVTPERSSGERRAGLRVTTTGGAAIHSETAQSPAGTQAAGKSNVHPTSSAEYIVGGLKTHKFAALAVLSALFVVLAVGGYYLSASRSSPTITSVAVLPFDGGDQNLEYLSDGLSESLIDRLSQLPQLKVIARSSAFKFKGKEIDPQEAAHALGVEAVVSGRVARRGDTLTVRAELVDARNGAQMWGEQFNRRAADIQEVQEEIARTVSEKLRLRLTAAQGELLAKHATQNPEAYQLFLNGLFYRRKGGIENSRKALDYYTQAVTLDPDFARAHTGVADAYRYLGAFGVLDPKEALAKARAAVTRALEVDETLAEAHVVLAIIRTDGWDWAGAESEYRRAVELNSNLAEAYYRHAQYLSGVGQHAQALAENKRAQELDPLRMAVRADEGARLYWARRYDEAAARLQEVLKLEPDNGYAHVYLGYTYAARGMYPQAIGEYQKQISIDGETASTLVFLGYALAQSGKRGEALAILDKLKTTNRYVSPAELSILYVGLGDKEAALSSLQRAYEAHDPQLQYLGIDPHRDSLRSDPRFADLVRRVGLPQ